jgi:hypothetical protein
MLRYGEAKKNDRISREILSFLFDRT